jgi:demethylmenaquinone methyltransferase/2-methoxy-6-polyprenyl-1,4-benzoquinol methylase
MNDNITEKRRTKKIRAMFNRISHQYDLLNRLLSAGQDMRWRRRAVELLGNLRDKTVLDLCCGTGDFAQIFLKKYGGCIRVFGADFAPDMLNPAKNRLGSKNNSNLILCQADALHIPLADESIDAVTVGFGIRNIADRLSALKEILRVLRPDGKLAIIEPAIPKNPVIGLPFSFYFRFVMPIIGGIVSGDYNAYRYLNNSVEDFPSPDDFLALMKEAGFSKAKAFPQTLGMVMIYLGEKGK